MACIVRPCSWGEGQQAAMRQTYMQVLCGITKFDCQALLLPKSSKKFDGSLKFASVQYIPRIGAAVPDLADQVDDPAGDWVAESLSTNRKHRITLERVRFGLPADIRDLPPK